MDGMIYWFILGRLRLITRPLEFGAFVLWSIRPGKRGWIGLGLPMHGGA